MGTEVEPSAGHRGSCVRDVLTFFRVIHRPVSGEHTGSVISEAPDPNDRSRTNAGLLAPLSAY